MEYFSKFEAAGATSDQGFAISEGPGAKTGSVDCQTDYVHIPNIIAQTPATPVPATEPLVVSVGDRICGDNWGTAATTYVSKYLLFACSHYLLFLYLSLYCPLHRRCSF